MRQIKGKREKETKAKEEGTKLETLPEPPELPDEIPLEIFFKRSEIGNSFILKGICIQKWNDLM